MIANIVIPNSKHVALVSDASRLPEQLRESAAESRKLEPGCIMIYAGRRSFFLCFGVLGQSCSNPLASSVALAH